MASTRPVTAGSSQAAPARSMPTSASSSSNVVRASTGGLASRRRSSRVYAVYQWHSYVHQHHVGREGLDRGDHLAAVGAFTDDVVAELGSQDVAQPGPHQLLIVGHQHRITSPPLPAGWPRVADDIYARSKGNSFFAEELLLAGEGRGPGALPSSLQEVLLARVVQLGRGTQELLGVGAGMDEAALLDGFAGGGRPAAAAARAGRRRIRVPPCAGRRGGVRGVATWRAGPAGFRAGRRPG